MKKKWLMMGGAVGISGVVMVTTGISAMAGTSGYDAYKAALKNTRTLQSVAVQASAELQDNGKELASAKGSVKASLANHTASGSVDVTGTGTEQSVDFYKQNNGTVVKSSVSDVYYVEQGGKWNRPKSKESGQRQQDFSDQAETVIDALVGNLKDYVSLSPNADGTKEVSVQLDDAQIPAVVNALAPIAIKQALSEHKNEARKGQGSGEPPFGKDNLAAVLPQLTQDIKLDKVAVKAEINASDYIQSQQADLTISGKDAGGTQHTLTLHLSAELSGYNSTTPDQIDLTGKKVQQRQPKFERKEWHGNRGGNVAGNSSNQASGQASGSQK